MFSKALLAGAALVAAAPALAQGGPEATYSGPRAEARINYDIIGSGVTANVVVGDRGSFGDNSSGQAFGGGAEVGYDHMISPRLVVGAYAGIDFSMTDINSPGHRPYSFSAGRNLYAGVRAGVPFARGAMVYVKGGYSNGNLRPKFGTGADPTLFANYDENRSGFHVGGGVEVPISGQTYARGEYVYSKYQTFDVSSTLDVPFVRHQIVAAFGVRF
jgi:outer membrane immunogenic protein